MKNLFSKIAKVAVALVMVMFTASIVSSGLGLDPINSLIGTASVVALLSFVPMPTNVLGATLLTEVFASEITKNLYPDNSFYKNSKDDSAWINANKVNLPQTGAAPAVSVDRTSLPATIAKRTDTAIDYTLNEFTTDPILIQHSEELIVNYNKRMSVLEDHIDKINKEVANNFIDIWLPTGATNQVRTTGAARAASSAGATGNRKAITKADLLEASRLMNRMDVPQEGRFMLINADMLNDILGISEFVDADKVGSSSKLVNGAIGRVLGFEVFVRSISGVYDNTGTPVKKSLAAATAATDNASALVWQKNSLRRAEGAVKVFDDVDKPEYYGSVFSALVRAGGRIARTDQKGVIAIVETATA